MASTSIQRSRTAGTTKTKFTLSMWVRKSANNAKYLLVNYTDDSNRGLIQFGGSDDFLFQSKYSNSNNAVIQTNRKFRDLNSWYHFVLTGDSTLATAADRTKLYVNGVRETSFAAETQISQNGNFYLNEATTNGFRIGEKGDGSDYFDGCMSHIHFCDGYAYEASSFGETDATTGEWIAKTSPSVTYGTNGFFLKFEDSSNLDLDSSGNALTFATNGNLIQTEDTPDNIFATMATPTWYDGTIANGGNTISTNATNYRYQPATIGVSKGKWYWEVKFLTASNYMLCGITDQPHYTTGSTNILGSGAYDYAIYYGNGTTGGGSGHMYNNAGGSPGNTPGQFMGALSQGDILTFALDCDNNTLKIGTNGNWANGSNATDQTFANTTAKTITAVGSTNTGFYHPAGGDYGGGTSVLQYNFGNGYFGTSAISTPNSDGASMGKFKYSVPSGYYALCTKNLNTQG